MQSVSDRPLVSAIIPTFNSEKTIGICLRSVSRQTYPNIEVIVVDSLSNDATRKIAEKFGAEIVTTNDKLLGARYRGLEESKGEHVLLLDSDQILEKTTIARAVKMLKEHDALCLEEHSYEPKTWIQKLFEADRRLIHSLPVIYLDPLEGVLMARFYRREVLQRAFEAIPKELMATVVAHDHAIIYYEAHRFSKKVGILPNAIRHIEPASLIELWRKNYRYGKTAKDLVKKDSYRNLLRKKVRFRKGVPNVRDLKYEASSFLLLALKGVAYQIGYWSA